MTPRPTSATSLTRTQRFLLSTAISAFVLGSGFTPSDLRAQTAKVLTVGSPFSARSLDPAQSSTGRAGLFVSPAYEPLVRTLPNGSLVPALAVTWEIAPDSKSATFTLRENAKFSDGEPVTAEAAKKSIEYWVQAKGPTAVNLSTMTGIDLLGKYKFRVNVSQSQPNLVSLFNAYWLSGHLISPKAVGTPALANQTFGAGPYKLDSAATVSGKSYIYVPNEHYYDKSRIHWDRIVIGVYEDQNSAVQAVRAGQLKLLVSDPLTANSNAGNLPKDVRIMSETVGWTGLILMDRDGLVQPALKDVRVRQAINHALDRKTITQALLGKYAEPTLQLQTRGFMGHDPKLEARYPYDLDKAKALLAEAGYKDGFELKVGYLNNTMSRFLTQAIAGQLRRIGIRVVSEEYQGFGPLANAGRQRSYAALTFNSNSTEPNLAKFQTLVRNGNLNVYGTMDPTLARLVEEASVLPIDKAEEVWKKVYSNVVELAWFAPVSAVHVTYFVSNSVQIPKTGQSIIVDLTDVKPAK